MKRSQLRQWLTERLIRQRRITLLAVAVMGGVGSAALLFELWLVSGLISYALIDSRFVSSLIALALCGSPLVWLWIRTPQRIGGTTHSVPLDDDELTVVVAPALGPVWTYALGSLETDKSFADRILGALSLPQRMVCTAWQIWLRYQQLQLIDVESCAKVLRLLYRKSERVGVAAISDECRLDDLPRTLHEMSLIDGVIFLTRHEFGLSLAPRLVEDLNAWNAGRQQDGDSGNDVFGD